MMMMYIAVAFYLVKIVLFATGERDVMTCSCRCISYEYFGYEQ